MLIPNLKFNLLYHHAQFDNIHATKLQKYQNFKKKLFIMTVTIIACVYFRYIAYFRYAE